MKNSQKKSLVLFFLVSAVTISFLPVINLMKQPKNLSLETLYNTDFIESYINYLVYKWGGKSTNQDNIVVGKQGLMFLGNKHNKLIYKTLDVYPYSTEQIKNWSYNLLQLQHWYENQGVEFLLVVAPNKHSIYAEHLPQWVKPAKNNLTDKLVIASKKINAHVLDLRPILLEEKSKHSELLYWKTDSHWNELGASIGFNATISHLNDLYREQLLIPKYHFETKSTSVAGDLARNLKFQYLLPDGFESKPSTVIDQENDVCVGVIDDGKPCQMKRRPYLGIHQAPQYSINPKALNKKNVLLFADSFIMQNSNLYHKTFETVWRQEYSHFTAEETQLFIRKHKPDIVIYQVVERNLFNNYFINIKKALTNKHSLE